MDIDGVLCHDPGFIKSGNSRLYTEFLQNAAPKFIPTKKVKYLVTSRKEAYRSLTEDWLRRYNVNYEHLIMPTIEIGGNLESGKYKGQFYKSTDCFLFIESNYEQAVEICKQSGKQVFCTENNRLINPENLLSHFDILQRDFRITAKQALWKIINRARKNKTQE
jgi:uncharacterized HAD superfamily protein